MAKQDRRPILAKGEELRRQFEPPKSPFKEPFVASFEEARVRVKKQLLESLDALANLQANRKIAGENILCMRLNPYALAKSYDPLAIFSASNGLKKIGSRNYRASTHDIRKTDAMSKRAVEGATQFTGRLVFVGGNEDAFQHFLTLLDRLESAHS
ncbi:MAG: hypothetical protein AAFX93_14595, partial [Verrucomicrobiota bacterium]